MTQAGVYWGRPISGITSQSSKGTPQIVVECEITQAAGDGTWNPIEPFKRSLYIHMSDAAWQYSQQRLNALKFNGDFARPQFDADGVELICSHDSYNGQLKEKWDVGGMEGAKPEPAPDGVARQLTAKWRAKNVGQSPPSKGPPKQPPPPPQQQPDPEPAVGDDGIPF